MRKKQVRLNENGLPIDLPTQGAQAGISGWRGERQIELAFESCGVRAVPDQPCYHMQGLWAREERYLIRQHPINDEKVDYLYKNFKSNFNLPIEAKKQERGGTTDQKLVYTIEMLVKFNFPFFWLVLSGDGWNPKVIKFIDGKIRAINAGNGVKGRIVYNRGGMMERAVEDLLYRGKIL